MRGREQRDSATPLSLSDAAASGYSSSSSSSSLFTSNFVERSGSAETSIEAEAVAVVEVAIAVRLFVVAAVGRSEDNFQFLIVSFFLSSRRPNPAPLDSLLAGSACSSPPDGEREREPHLGFQFTLGVRRWRRRQSTPWTGVRPCFTKPVHFPKQSNHNSTIDLYFLLGYL